MKKNILFAFRGWLAALVTTVMLGLIWPQIIPGIVHGNHYYGDAMGLPLIILVVFIQVSPLALIAGLIGGNIPKEGGKAEQNLMAMIFGVMLALACGVYGFLSFSGW